MKRIAPFSLALFAATALATGDFPVAEANFSNVLARIYPAGAPTGNLACVRFERADWPDGQRYAISSGPTDIIVRAAGEMGANYAAARILRETGWRRFAPHPSWEILPASPPASILLDADEAPDYRSRRIWSTRKWPESATNGHNAAWEFCHRLGGDAMNVGHAYERFVRLNKAFLVEHPECLALVGGKRVGNKLCISNPLLREKFADFTASVFDASPEAASASVEPSDGGGWCECAECAKLGTPTDRAITLANAAVAEVRRRHPGKKVALYAYNQHSPPPHIPVDSDVVVFVATGFLRQGWTPDALLSAWSKVAATGIREYYYNDSNRPSTGRAASLPDMAATLPRFHAAGARFITCETTVSWAAGLIPLNVAAELMWDVSADPMAIRDEIVRAAFPSAPEEMGAFFALIDGERRQPLSEDLLARMFGLLSNAWEKAAAALSADEIERLAQMAGYAHYCEALLAYDRAPTGATATNLFEAAAALRPYQTVASRAFQKDGRNFGNPGKDIAHTFDWNSPRPVEAAKWIAEGLERNKRLPFEPTDWGLDLVPADAPADAGGAILQGNSRGGVSFWMWCDGDPFELGVTGGLIAWYRDRGNVKLRLVQIGGESETGELETEVWRDESVPPDGERRVLSVVPRHPGLHRLEASDGGDMTKYDFPTNLAVAVAGPACETRQLHGDYWLYVPKGVGQVGFFARTLHGRLLGPDGRPLFSLEGKNGHFTCEVPPGADGRFWCVRGLNGRLNPMTVPAVLNINPLLPLVPRTALDAQR